MILVDTSVWIDHLRKGDPQLQLLLENGTVLIHPFIVGEIALGSLRQRTLVLELLNALPAVITATHEEVMLFLDAAGLHGKGIGYVDAHLLASVRLHAGARLWTRDQRLKAVAGELDLAFTQTP